MGLGKGSLRRLIKRKSDMVEYACKHCQGAVQIMVLGDSEKATEPVVEFCPFCGIPNFYREETD